MAIGRRTLRVTAALLAPSALAVVRGDDGGNPILAVETYP